MNDHPRPDRASRAALRAAALATALSTALAAGCTLLPDPPAAPRVYRVPSSDAPAAAESAPAGRLRLRTVASAAYLDEGVAWRSGVQVGIRPGVRWAERPEVVLQHALLTQLFSGGRLVRTEAIDAPLLDVDLLAFEELLDEGGDVALVELRARVLDESRDEVLSLELQSRQPLAADGDRTEALARALGAGLDDVCSRLAVDVVRTFRDGARLPARPAPASR